MSILLNGTTQYISVNTDLSAQLGSLTTSMCCWIKTTQVGGAEAWGCPGITGVEEHGGDNDIFWGFIDNTGLIGMQAGDGANTKVADAVNDGKWHWIYMSRVPSTGALFIRKDNTTASVTSDTGAKTTAFTRIGSIESTSPYGITLFLSGSLADIRIYTRLLSTAEQDTIYGSNGHDNIEDSLWLRYTWYSPEGSTLAGPVYDSSGNGRTGTLIASPTGIGVPFSFKNRIFAV